MPRLRDIPSRAWIALALVLVIGGGIRAYEAQKDVSRLSLDARSYLRLARDFANDGYRGDQQALRWPPGTPALFALAYTISPDPYANEADLAAPRWAQFVVSTGTILATFLLAWLLVASPWAGVLAAALVAFYPPLWWGPSNLLSEPFGSLLVTLAFVGLTAGLRSNRWPWYAAAGAMFGAVLLTRTDLLFVPAVLAVLVLAVTWRRLGWRRGVLNAGVMAAALAIVIAPWVWHASRTAGRLVPITAGGGSAFFVGTFLPGNGSTFGMKLALRDETVRRHPSLRNTYYKDIPASVILADVAARHPELSRDNALLAEARKNLKDAILHHPGKFAGIVGNKFAKMWFRATLGGARHPMHLLRIYHVFLLLLAASGLGLALWRRRDPAVLAILIALAVATAVHMLAVAHGRYALPLLPVVFAAGTAGWWDLLRARHERRRAATDGAAPAGDPGGTPAPGDALPSAS